MPKRKRGSNIGSQHSSFKCTECGEKFQSKYNLKRHSKIHNEGEKSFPCSQCSCVLSRQDSLIRHLDEIHNTNKLNCNHCEQLFTRKKN